MDHDANPGGTGGTVYLLEGRSFDKFTSLERGGYDDLLGADTDTDMEFVRRELADWGRWLVLPANRPCVSPLVSSPRFLVPRGTQLRGGGGGATPPLCP